MEEITSYFGYDKVLPICTVGTEGSKSAILSSFRAFGLDADTAQRISDLIPIERGKNWDIKDCVFGNEKKDREPVKLIQKYYKQYKEIFDVAMEIEGLINKRSQHASGVLISPTNYLDYNAMMKTPKGTRVSQYCMTESEKCGLIKEDLLFTEYESKLQTCLEFMKKDGLIKGETAKELYQFITPDNLNLEDEKIWKEIFHNGNVSEVFQMEGQTGIAICEKVKPNNIQELSAANSLMRLKSDISVEFIAKQDGFEGIEVTDFMKKLFETETLSDKYLRYKNNPQHFINDTVKFGVPKDYALRIADTLQDTYGVCVSQEDLMKLLMNIFEFNITEAHKVRKAIAKKKPALLEDGRILMLKYANEKDIPLIVAFYVWLLIMGTAGYAFSVVHAYSYSLIGYQGAFLKYYYPLYWHTACLAINAQSITVENGDEEKTNRNKTTDYAKISQAIFDLQQEGIPVNHPNINKSDFSFSPDKETNTILYGLKALDRVGDEIAQQIIELRPYKDFEDFLNKNVCFDNEKYPNRKKLNKNTMSSLIFSNSFECLGTKKSECVVKYLGLQVNDIGNLTTRYLDELKENKLLPNEFDNFKNMQNALVKIKKFQCKENKKAWKIPYNEYEITQHIYDFFYDNVIENNGEYILLEKKSTNAKYKEIEEKLKIWLNSNSEILQKQLKNVRIKTEYQDWTKGQGISDLAFKAMGMYLGNSWLDNASEKYNISEFLKLPLAEDNIVSWGKYRGSEYPIFNITQIPLTVIDKESKHKVITGMTKGAIIKCKMKDNTYDYYSKYFERGKKLILWGYRGRTEDSFTIKLYNSVRKDYIDTHTIIEVI